GSGNAPTTVNAGTSSDTFNINTNSYTVAAAQNGITINANTGADIINFNTQSGPLTFDIFATSFGGTRLPTYSHSSIERLNINGGTGAETFLLWSTSAATETVVNAGNGNDSIYMGGAVSGTFVLDNILGPVTVNGQAGSDQLFFNDASELSSEQFQIS